MNNLFQKINDALPIFKIDYNDHYIIYTPGYFILIEKEQAETLEAYLNFLPDSRDSHQIEELPVIYRKAHEALNTWNAKFLEPFSPECLTLHVGNACNLDCSYCYTKNKRTQNDRITGFPEIETIKIVLERIFNSEYPYAKPFTIVYHGSGEPAIVWDWVVESFDLIRDQFRKHNIETFFYIATNGFLTDSQIEWLAHNMNLIGISCDGSDDVQHTQRPTRNGNYYSISETCRKIELCGGKFDIRVTVTKDTIAKLPEIVRYLIHDCKAENIRIEPVYLAGENGFTKDYSEVFLENFKQARKYASDLGKTVFYPGVRLEEIHGTYCDVLRNTLRLTSDGLTRNCFCYMNDGLNFITGITDYNSGKFELKDNIGSIKEKSNETPMECHQCINIFHCSRGCPDFCLHDENLSTKRLNPFRCKFHQLLTVDTLKSSANLYFQNEQSKSAK
jgi:sulfatase maturation enzyme AslB (radical SAM superfamily)